MIEQGGGKVLNVARTAGLGGAMPEVLDAIAYNASKGGLINFTRDLAVKWGRFRINVNAIAPGWFTSRMSNAIVERWGDRLARNLPLGRIGGGGGRKGPPRLPAPRGRRHGARRGLPPRAGRTAASAGGRGRARRARGTPPIPAPARR